MAGNKIKRILKLARANFLAFPRIIPILLLLSLPLSSSFFILLSPNFSPLIAPLSHPSNERLLNIQREPESERMLSPWSKGQRWCNRERERNERVKRGWMSKSNSRLELDEWQAVERTVQMRLKSARTSTWCSWNTNSLPTALDPYPSGQGDWIVPRENPSNPTAIKIDSPSLICAIWIFINFLSRGGSSHLWLYIYRWKRREEKQGRNRKGGGDLRTRRKGLIVIYLLNNSKEKSLCSRQVSIRYADRSKGESGVEKELVVAAISAFFILRNRRMMLLRDGNRIPRNVRAGHPTLHPYNIADAFSHDKQWPLAPCFSIILFSLPSKTPWIFRVSRLTILSLVSSASKKIGRCSLLLKEKKKKIKDRSNSI